MYNKLQKISALFLALLLTSSVVAGCAADNTVQETDAIPETETAAVEEPLDERLSPNLEIRDLNGTEFRILGNAPDGGGNWTVHDMTAEELNGEALNDHIYERNLFLGETYNFTISVTTSTNKMQNEIENIVIAGDTSYHVFGSEARSAALSAQNGYVLNLKSLDNLDFSQPYWSASMLKPLEMDGRLFMSTGDITVVTKEGVRAYYFNKGLVQDCQLENPYDLVKENKWTLDTMFSMLEAASEDVDGNGQMSTKDRFGYIGQAYTGIVNYLGTGESFVAADADGNIVMTANTERAMDIMTKVAEIMQTHRKNIYLGDWKQVLSMFGNGQALFFTEVMLHIATMRDYEIDIGILPVPKLDAQQEEFSHWVDYFCTIFYTMPICVPDAEEAAYILEAIAAASRYYITPAFYEICLKTKYARDEESSEMLDIIFSTYRLELSDVYGMKIRSALQEPLNGSSGIASKVAALVEQTEQSITDICEKYQSNATWN